MTITTGSIPMAMKNKMKKGSKKSASCEYMNRAKAKRLCGKASNKKISYKKKK